MMPPARSLTSNASLARIFHFRHSSQTGLHPLAAIFFVPCIALSGFLLLRLPKPTKYMARGFLRISADIQSFPVSRGNSPTQFALLWSASFKSPPQARHTQTCSFRPLPQFAITTYNSLFSHRLFSPHLLLRY